LAAGVTLDTDVQFVRGVGPVRAQALARLGVSTVNDLIHYFPFRHEHKPKSTAKPPEKDTENREHRMQVWRCLPIWYRGA